MRLLKLLFCVVFAFSCLSLVFSSISLNASAVVDPNYHIMTAQETREYIGTSLTGQVLLSDNTFSSVTFTHTGSNSDVAAIDPSDYNFDADWLQGRVLLRYDADVTGLSLANQSRDHGGRLAMVSIPFSAQNVTHFDFPMFSWCDLGEVSSAGYTYCADYAYYEYTDSRYSSSAFSVGYCERGTSTNSVATIRVGWNGTGCIFYRPHWYVSQNDNTPFSISFISLSCPFMYSENNKISIFLACPEVNSDIILGGSSSDPDWGDGLSVGEVTGTIEDDGNGSQNINVTVTTDNSGFLSGLLNGLRSLFVPSQEYMNTWHSDIEDSFSEHLGGVSEAVDLIDEQADYLRAATSADYIYFPELKLPIGSNGFSSGHETIGADYVLIQGHQVELRPARTGKLKILWDFVEFAVDAVCVLAVFNMLQTKYEIFLNPDGEVITYDN